MYVAGLGAAANGNYTAGLSKNGVITNLTNGTNIAYASSVFESGNDVFVLGFEETNNSNSYAMYWENGIITRLTDGTKQDVAYSVYVFGKDVYIVGYEPPGTFGNGIAKLWKNGTAQDLSDE